ncbi:MAG: hypothetical protein Q9217_000770 [Psora testacea]
MLRSHAVSPKVSLPWRPAFGPFQTARALSTNTAINRSLREAKKSLLNRRDINQKPRRSNPVSNSDYGRPTTRLAPSKQSLFAGPGQRSSLKKHTPGKSKYDYSRNLEGNRATRRAAKFSNKTEAIPTAEISDLAQLLPKSHQAPRSAPHNHSDEIRFVHDAPARGPGGDTQRRKTYPKSSSKPFSQQPHQPEAPLAIPYTTSASEFLYGTSVIKAALQASRRKFYKLYMYDGDNRDVPERDAAIRGLALRKDLVVERVKGDWLRLMDKMSQGRPHNGYILEASPLPKLPITALERVEESHHFKVVLDHQSREDEAINGRNHKIDYQTTYLRYPFVLLLDGILDSGNLGAIMRSAFFLGVDAVAVSSHSAPFSPVSLKASAGAAECLPLVTVAQPNTFIDACKKNGWKAYAADASSEYIRKQKRLATSNLGSPLQRHPCILILGSEGEGLRWKIQEKADFDVGIEGQRGGQGGVDSLNVSVAAGLLCEAFLRKPNAMGKLNAIKTTGGEREELLF